MVTFFTALHFVRCKDGLLNGQTVPFFYFISTPTWFDFHDHRFAVLVSHLPDVQQVVRISVVPRPSVHKYAWAAAPAVHHHAVVQIGVTRVGGLHVRHPWQTSGSDQMLSKYLHMDNAKSSTH